MAVGGATWPQIPSTWKASADDRARGHGCARRFDWLNLTLDADFRIYRRHRNKVVPVLMPEDPNPDSYLAESPVRYRVKRKPAKSP